MRFMCRWVCVCRPSVHALFWAVIVRQRTQTDPRQHNGSKHQSHNNLFCVSRVCVCVCAVGVHLYFKASFVWLTLYYDE